MTPLLLFSLAVASVLLPDETPHGDKAATLFSLSIVTAFVWDTILFIAIL